MGAIPSRKEEVQQVCIDLPGESVQCWRSRDKLRVVLRKHRDIVFDLRLNQPGSYTVESTRSHFYHADKKRLRPAGPKGALAFSDGEKVHIWVSREFQGELLLKYDGRLMMRLEPNAVDQRHYDETPRAKPAPIIVSLGQKRVAPAVGEGKRKWPQDLDGQHGRPHAIPQPAAAPVGDEHALVCVCDGSLKGAPKKVLDALAKGGGKSGLTDIDPNEVATRNWLLGQLAGTTAYVADNWEWLRESIDRRTHTGMRLVRAQVRNVRGKVRFYFSGYSRLNAVFGPGGFGPANERIVTIFAGVGKTSSSFEAIGKGVLGTLKGNALVSLIFSSATSYAEWKADLTKDGYDLSATLLMGLIKALVVAALTVAVVALLLLCFVIGFGVGVPVLAVGAMTLLVGVGVSYAVDAWDKAAGRELADKPNSDGVAGVIAPAIREAAQRIEATWRQLRELFPRDYEEIYF